MDYTPSSRRLSEISHLFLTDVRQKQTGDSARPARTPPGGYRGDVSIDLTPEEFAQSLQPAAGVEQAASFKPLRAVIAHHLGEAMTDRVRDLAATLGGTQHVGVIYAGDAGLRVCCVEPNTSECDVEEAVSEAVDAQRLREVLVEMDQDVCQWLLVLPYHRSPDSQALLAMARDWTLLSTADHDGVVSAYRALKGVCGDARPRLSVAVLDAANADETEKTCRKLAGVCEQFLKVGVSFGPAVSAVNAAREFCLLDATTDSPDSPHWSVLAALAEGAASPELETTTLVTDMPNPIAPVVRSIPAPAPVMRMTPAPADDAAMVIDLVDTTPAAIAQAVVREGGDLFESPVKAPALPDAVVAVSKDHRLTLVAVARPGLSDLRSVVSAFRWMTENRALIAMAVPQLAINAAADPRLHVLVDPTDADAAAVHPLLATTSTTVAAFRKVRWGGKTGLLLNAA